MLNKKNNIIKKNIKKKLVISARFNDISSLSQNSLFDNAKVI